MIAVGRDYDKRAWRIRDNTVARMMARLKAAGVSAAVGDLRELTWAHVVDLNIEGAGEPVLLIVEDGHVRFDGSCERIAVRKNRATFHWLLVFAATMREQAKAAAKRQGRAAKDAEALRRMKLLNEQAPTIVADVAAMMLARDVDDREVSRADAAALLERCKAIVTPEDIGRLAMDDAAKVARVLTNG